MRLSLQATAFSVIAATLVMCSIEARNKGNLLFIMFDDLRPDLNCYGRSHMITPNFDRLCHKSVVFDNAFAQVAVCNPSRDSIMTGLRPDTVGTYGFQESFRPHIVFPTHLNRVGYKTAAYGKIFHWDGFDRDIWTYDQDGMDWYIYQAYENNIMNSTTMPDKHTPIEEFRDYKFASKAISTLRNLTLLPDPFMLGIGFKQPHLAMHVPYKYYDMYKDRKGSWKLTDKERTFPVNSSILSYRCCSESHMRFMNQESEVKSTEDEYLMNSNQVDIPISERMRDELMLGYAAGITFVDTQLGRVLDAIDELKLWNNITIILTADHGMHNGEKGIWEKWTLFDESTHVPLMIYDPESPFKGRHYPEPVELIDIYPTILDLLRIPLEASGVCHGVKNSWIDRCIPLQGKSLASIVMGQKWASSLTPLDTPVGDAFHDEMPLLSDSFAISQMWRCGTHGKNYKIQPDGTIHLHKKHLWSECNKKDRILPIERELSMMGYSMRTLSYRYTLWVPFSKVSVQPNWTINFEQEELYDHFREIPSDFTHKENVNLANNPLYADVRTSLRSRLLMLLKEEFIYLGPIYKMVPSVGYMRNGTVLEESSYGKAVRIGVQGGRKRRNKRHARKVYNPFVKGFV